MCGRLSQKVDVEALRERFTLTQEGSGEGLGTQVNGAPGLTYACVRGARNGRSLDALHWGFVPGWARGHPDAKALINARSETAHMKPTFRNSFRERRCVVPVNGWFEWREEKGRRQPYWIRGGDGEVMGLAGLWERTLSEGRRTDCFVILTCPATADVAHLHHRQPVILGRRGVDAWLAEETQERELFIAMGESQRQSLRTERMPYRISRPGTTDPAMHAALEAA